MLIAIEGPTGIGKSTLQGLLASVYSSETLIMSFEKHPYFVVPNLELSEYALEREMIFMLMGYHQLKNSIVADKLIISDFLFDRFKAFAATVLPRVDLESVFYPCFHYLRRNLPKPDLVVRLVGSPTFVLSRIRRRNRSDEDYVTEDYLAGLELALNAIFEEAQDYNVITLNSEELDFVKGLNARQTVTLLLESELPQVRAYRKV